jgi:hypothetical protein
VLLPAIVTNAGIMHPYTFIIRHRRVRLCGASDVVLRTALLVCDVLCAAASVTALMQSCLLSRWHAA